jgi:hypothetical protein
MNPSHHIGLLGWARVYLCSDVVDFLKSCRTYLTIRLILIAIGVEPEYRSITRSLSGWGPKGEPNAPITAKSEVADFLRLLQLIWQSDSSMIAIANGSEVADFYYRWRYHAASFGLAVPCWLGLNKFLLRWWHIACWSLNVHQCKNGSHDLSHRFAPVVGLFWSLSWIGVPLDEKEPDFIS